MFVCGLVFDCALFLLLIFVMWLLCFWFVVLCYMFDCVSMFVFGFAVSSFVVFCCVVFLVFNVFPFVISVRVGFVVFVLRCLFGRLFVVCCLVLIWSC